MKNITIITLSLALSVSLLPQASFASDYNPSNDPLCDKHIHLKYIPFDRPKTEVGSSRLYELDDKKMDGKITAEEEKERTFIQKCLNIPSEAFIEQTKVRSKENGLHNIIDANWESRARIDITKPLTIVDKETWLKTNLDLMKIENFENSSRDKLLNEKHKRYTFIYTTTLELYKTESQSVARINKKLKAHAKGMNTFQEVDKAINDGRETMRKIGVIAAKYNNNFKRSIHLSRVASKIERGSMDTFNSSSYKSEAERSENLATNAKYWHEYLVLVSEQIKDHSHHDGSWGSHYYETTSYLDTIEESLFIESSQSNPNPLFIKVLKKMVKEINLLRIALEDTEVKEKKEQSNKALAAFLDD